ncbi:MAG: tRNA 2-selenouridine(34) synthase MnmH [Betaproteobacteria bacterium]
MSLTRIPAADAAAALDSFDAIIDVRSESEYAADHLPGAVNWPSLTDAERAVVGTRYRQISDFEARRLGAALVARNIAGHLEREVQDKPRDWRPLVYCWRGGKRSGTLAWFLDQIGFRVHLLDGGYKAFRRVVAAELAQLPLRFGFSVVCGRTGSGKTRLLHALAAAGAQVLDLEALAAHRGSVLGLVPGRPQPTQKAFETAIWDALRRLDPARPLFVESESRKIGNLRVPEALIERMRRDSACLHVEMPQPARVALLLEDYAFFADDPELFCAQLEALVEVRGRADVNAWQALARAGRWAEVYAALMAEHYDPMYLKSMQRNFAGFEQATPVALEDGAPATLARVARQLVEDERAQALQSRPAR